MEEGGEGVEKEQGGTKKRRFSLASPTQKRARGEGEEGGKRGTQSPESRSSAN